MHSINAVFISIKEYFYFHFLFQLLQWHEEVWSPIFIQDDSNISPYSKVLFSFYDFKKST